MAPEGPDRICCCPPPRKSWVRRPGFWSEWLPGPHLREAGPHLDVNPPACFSVSVDPAVYWGGRPAGRQVQRFAWWGEGQGKCSLGNSEAVVVRLWGAVSRAGHAGLEPASLCVEPRCGGIASPGFLSSCVTCVPARTQARCASTRALVHRTLSLELRV